MKRTLVILIVAAMIPVFMGLFCPCAHAVSGPNLEITKPACLGCCPEMAAGPNCKGETIQRSQAVSASEISKVIISSLKALSPRASLDIAINRRAYVPAGDEPLFSFSTPLYLAIRVLRI